VQHIESGEKFVLKQIPISARSAEKESAAFSEVDVLSRLSHPNITTLYGAWASESMLNILMEYADRGSLADVLKSKHGSTMLFDEDAILDWFVQIISALRAMHARSILHRDLKAANVFLTSRNLIKVGDFGISKMLEKNDGLASTTIGTPYYLAPEVRSRPLLPVF
jgi:NIMA (never in mitosis gene a)-related kinase